jgi:hypothetical protein
MMRVLAAEPMHRAEAIRRLYADPESRGMAELLMDLEANGRVKADVMEVLKESLKEGRRPGEGLSACPAPLHSVQSLC